MPGATQTSSPCVHLRVSPQASICIGTATYKHGLEDLGRVLAVVV